MPTDEQYDELRRMIAGLTERVYLLEQTAGLRERRERPMPLPANAPAEPVLPPARDTQGELESRIGGHWLNRLGILAVLIGVSYFLNYAFENDWIGSAGRVLIGLGGGIGIVVWSERIRRQGYAVFSYSMKAIGIGVVYLSLWASSQLYHLIPNLLAFLAMMSVTAATVALALQQNAEVIAAFAAIGAFITPIALSTGENNAVGLFGYVLLLDAGAVFLVAFRPWARVLLGSFAGTAAIYSAWHNQFYTTDQFWTAMIAISALFLAFVVATLIYAPGPRSASRAIQALALLNGATYFFQMWELFAHSSGGRPAAVAAVGLACLYFLLGHQLGSREASTMSGLHWAIGAAFVVAAVPIGLDASWITIAWFALGAALFRAGRRRETEYLAKLGAVALGLATFKILAVDHSQTSQLLLNERMLAFALGLAALADVARGLVHETGEKSRQALGVVIVAINVLAPAALTGEITDEWRRRLQASEQDAYRTLTIARDFAYSALWMAYGACVMIVGFWKESRFLRWQALILIGITVFKVFLYDTSSLDRGYRVLSLITLGLVLLTTSFLYQRSRPRAPSA